MSVGVEAAGRRAEPWPRSRSVRFLRRSSREKVCGSRGMVASRAGGAVALSSAEEEPGPIAHQKILPSKDYTVLLKEVTATTGKSYFAQVKEMLRLSTGLSGLSPM